MNIETINQIQLSRHLYELSLTNINSNNDLYLFAGINLLQDSVESMLLAIAHHVNAQIKPKTYFEQYFDLINNKLANRVLPFQPKLIQLNKIRVNAKHYGVQPPRAMCESLAVVAREFFDEVCNTIFGVIFSSVSALELIDDGEAKSFLSAAKKYYEAEDFLKCSICCRKAIYVQIEQYYDISPYKDGKKPAGLLGPICFAPYYTRNQKYIEENVKSPTDFIVYDHSQLDQDLLKKSVDLNKFWNVWRLTSNVYRNESGVWFCKDEPSKSSNENLEENIEYILNATIDIILSIHLNKKSFRILDYESYAVELTECEIPVYEKADKKSKVIRKTPKSLKSLVVGYSTTGLRDDGKYWNIMHFERTDVFAGYIEDIYVKKITKGIPENIMKNFTKPQKDN